MDVNRDAEKKSNRDEGNKEDEKYLASSPSTPLSLLKLLLCVAASLRLTYSWFLDTFSCAANSSSKFTGRVSPRWLLPE